MWLNSYRYVILAVGFICLVAISANVSTINFTIICMADANKDSNTSLAETNSTGPRLSLSQTEKSAIRWASGIGTLLGAIPANILVQKHGARFPFFVSGLISIVGTAVTPVAIATHFYFLLVASFLQGLAYSADFAALGSIVMRWAPLPQTGFFIGVLSSFSPVSFLVVSPTAGWLCESKWGWPMMNYGEAVATFVLFLIWLLVYTDNPETNSQVSDIEAKRISANKTVDHASSATDIPYLKICSNKIILLVWLNAIAEICSGVFMAQYAPTYFHRILGYDIQQTGWYTSLPNVVQLPLRIVAGFLSDNISCLSEIQKMRIFNSVALGVAGLSFIAICFVPQAAPGFAVALFTLIQVFMAANCGGFYKCGTLVSRQYSSFVLSNIQFCKCLTLFTSPALMAIFVSDETNPGQWKWVFAIYGVFLIVANVIFCIFVTDKPAAFTKTISESAAELEEAANRNISLREKTA